MKYFILILALFMTGCDVIKPSVNVEEKHNIVNVYSEVDQLAISLRVLSKEDLIERYKFFRGMSLFCENAPSDMTMTAVRQALDKTQRTYGWEPQKYPDASQDVIDFMKSKNWYQEKLPNKNISSYRDELVKTFNTLAEACKRAIQAGVDR